MATCIRVLMQNFTLTFLVLGLLAAGGVLLGRRPLTSARVAEALLAHFLLFSIGIGFLYNAVLHIVFGDMTARFIGWDQSPFQAEVGTASLGYALVGFLAFRGGFGLRLAAVIGPGVFLLGAAVGHAYQMIAARNFAPGNAGVIFYTDLALPLLGAFFLWFRYRRAAGVAGS